MRPSRSVSTRWHSSARAGLWVRMKMNGHPASPLQIASAHAVKEELSYMRDYVADENGKVKEVRFVKLSNIK